MKSLENYSNVLISKGAILLLLFFYKKYLARIREHIRYTKTRGIFSLVLIFLCRLFIFEVIYNIDLFLRILVRCVPYPLYPQHLILGQLLLDDLKLDYLEE